MTGRNLVMIQNIEQLPIQYPYSFVVAGDSGAWADPTAERIFGQIVDQISKLDQTPIFFANLGDFAGPGTTERHERYLGLIEPLPIPNICVVGNHDLDDPGGPEVWDRVHGPMNYDFAYGHTRFVVIHAEPGIVGEIDVPDGDSEEGTEGPRDTDLEFLEAALARSNEPHLVVLMHMPPNMGGHFAPHQEWGFKQREQAFFEILHEHDVKLVCCAHGLAFDDHLHQGIRFITSGGGGTGLCSHWRGVCSPGEGRPEDRGALFHAVRIEISENGSFLGHVLQAFAPPDARARYSFDGFT